MEVALGETMYFLHAYCCSKHCINTSSAGQATAVQFYWLLFWWKQQKQLNEEFNAIHLAPSTWYCHTLKMTEQTPHRYLILRYSNLSPFQLTSTYTFVIFVALTNISTRSGPMYLRCQLNLPSF